eukprot:1152732-Pelagomonas_calceolata.AAC.1
MDACNTERLRSLDMEFLPGNSCQDVISDDVQRNIPHWNLPSGRPPNTQLSHPGGIIVLLLEGRDPTHHPKDINPRDIHLIELKLCADTKPEPPIKPNPLLLLLLPLAHTMRYAADTTQHRGPHKPTA